MKTQGIFPEHYAAHATQTDLERDRQLAGLYLRYQRFLQDRDLSDADGLLWLAYTHGIQYRTGISYP